MSSRYAWLAVLVVAALFVAACGPEMTTPTAPAEEEVVAATPTGDEEEAPTSEPASAADVPLDEDDWHVLGSADAPVTIVDYSDFQWPFCASYVRETFPQLLEEYVDTGKVRYIFRNFPLLSIHPEAQKAAEAAECAGEQGSYWDMHEKLFESQEEWSGQTTAVETFKELAARLELDQGQFDACLDEGAHADRVASDLREGEGLGVTGTPNFRINGLELSGAQPFTAFQQQIEYFLAGGEAPSAEVGADSFRSLGEPDAPVVVTEYADFQWPACASIAREVIPELISRYVDTGKARYVYREFPLPSHPNAQKASEAAICAGRQDKEGFWEMNEKLYATVGEWGQAEDPSDVIKSYVGELGLDEALFVQCLDEEEAAFAVQADVMAGQMVGVNATPYFFVNDIPIRGGLPIDPLGRVIDYAAAGGGTPQIVPGLDDWHLRGDPMATAAGVRPAITVAFVDFANPESAKHATEVLPLLLEAYVDEGTALYVLQPWSSSPEGVSAEAAKAAECAGQQGQGWEMHDILFVDQETWTQVDDPGALFTGYAEDLDLDISAFEECLVSDWAALRVESGAVAGALVGVPGAPVFLFNNGQGEQGSPTFEEFQTIIDSILNQ